MRTTLRELAWLHDCGVTSITYDTSDESSRYLKLVLVCPTDLGHPQWSGKTLRLTAIDVRVASHLLWGTTTGAENLDAIREGISAELRARVSESERAGLGFPPLAFTIVFTSGSSIEVVCAEIDVEILVN